MRYTDSVLMVRPVCFEYNEQTASTNLFQEKTVGMEPSVNSMAQIEFDVYNDALHGAGIHVVAVEDTPNPPTPDSIFPNNWFSTHTEEELYGDKAENPHGTVVIIYPMCAPNRRAERKKRVLPVLEADPSFNITKVIDLTEYEQENCFLEGTGSLVLDRENKIAYCCRSVRSNERVLKRWAEATGYRYVLFDAVDNDNVPIYHTNVMMNLGEGYVVICMDAVSKEKDRELLADMFRRTGREIIPITFEQVCRYAGNMIVLKNVKGESVLIMSHSAKESLTKEQSAALECRYSHVVVPQLDCIEKNGGGSARCMLAEIFR